MTEKINVEIKTDYDGSDAKQAISDAEKLEQLKPEVEITADTTALDDVKSKGAEMAAAIKQAAIDMDTELRNTALAVDALSTALGSTAEKMDVPQVVADLQRIGLTADDVRLDADQLAEALKFADDLDTGRVNSELGSTGAALDKVHGSADQSRSVLANMSGNVAQDLGELGGVAGSTGVLIGQLAEYATEGNISLKQLGQLAGPMAGLAALTLGVQMVTSGLADLKKRQQEYTAQFTDFDAAVRSSGSQFQAINDMLTDNVLLQPAPELNWWQSMMNDLPGLGSMLDETSQHVDTVSTSLADAGISQQEWFDAMRVDIPGGLQRYNDLNAKLLTLKDSGQITGAQFDLLSEQFTRQGEIVAANASTVQAAAQTMVASTGDITAAMQDNWAATEHTRFLWDQILSDLADGRTDTQNAAAAWNELRDSLHLTDAQMSELAQQKLDEQLAADTAAADEAASKILEMRDAIDAAKQAGQEYNQVVASQEWGATSIEAAQTAMSGYFDQFMGATDHVADLEAAYDGLDEALTAANDAGVSWSDTLFDMNSPESRQARSALRELGDSLIPDIQEAYDDADGDQAKFADNMHTLAEETLAALQERLGLTQDEVNALAQELGLVPENVETMYELLGDEDAKLKLGLLQGVIDDLPENVQTDVTMKIIQGDWQGALDAVEAGVSGGVTTPLYLDTSPALQAFWALQGAIRLAGIATSINASVSTSGLPSTQAAGSAPVNVTMHLPRGTRPDDAMRALDRWTRRNGRARATRR